MPEGIKAGSLFVDLGIKGGDKTVGTLASTQKGMGAIASMSLEAKAGILAAVYGLERMMQTSARFGATLTNYKALTGVSPILVQQYMYAARQVNVANEDVLGSFKALQGSLAQIDINKGLPEGLKYISNVIGGFDTKKLHDLPYMMQQLQKFAQAANVGEGVKRWALGTTGLSEGMVTASMRNAFQPDIMARAPVYSEKELANLDKVNAAWSNLGNKVEMAFGRFTGHHGQAMVRDIEKIALATIHLADAVERLGQKVHAFERLGHILEGMANTVKLVNEVIDKLSGKESHKGDLLYSEPGGEVLPGWKGSVAQKYLSDEWAGIQAGFARMTADFRLLAPNGGSKVEVNQNITHVGDAKDTKSVKELHRAAAQAERNHAYRQSGANLKGN